MFRKIEVLSDELFEINKNLENKVKQRTSSLQEALEKIEKAQLETEEELELASNIQKSYLPNKIPEFKNWDLAYYFRPMSSVSGDFYDFYHDQKELWGFGLFDVSGHGISSGLITMIAKSIIFRHFKN